MRFCVSSKQNHFAHRQRSVREVQPVSIVPARALPSYFVPIARRSPSPTSASHSHVEREGRVETVARGSRDAKSRRSRRRSIHQHRPAHRQDRQRGTRGDPRLGRGGDQRRSRTVKASRPSVCVARGWPSNAERKRRMDSAARLGRKVSPQTTLS